MNIETAGRDINSTLSHIGAILGGYIFRVNDECHLQSMVIRALQKHTFVVQREVIADRRTRFDLLVKLDDFSIVIELKIRGSSSAVERQAQRYAMIENVDAVCVVTTSARLAHRLPTDTLGGKPFRAMALRTM